MPNFNKNFAKPQSHITKELLDLEILVDQAMFLIAQPVLPFTIKTQTTVNKIVNKVVHHV